MMATEPPSSDLDDPFIGILDRSSIAQSLREARASLSRPSRPFTPASRSLFQQADEPSCSRPSSSYSIDQLSFVKDSFASSMASSAPLRREKSEGLFRPISEVEVLTFDADCHAGPGEEYECRGADDLALQMDVPPPNSDEEESDDDAGQAKRGKSCRERAEKMRKPAAAKAARLGSHGACPAASAGDAAWSEALQHVLDELESLGGCQQLDAQMLVPFTDKVKQLAADADGAQHEHSPQQEAQAAKLMRATLALMECKADSLCMIRIARSALDLLRLDCVLRAVGTPGVSAAHLNVVKALFKLSKDAAHDTPFREEGVLELLLRRLSSGEDGCITTDCGIFMVGILKNTTHCDENQRFLGHHDAMPTLHSLMRPERLTGSSKESQLLVQVTALLRNLAASPRMQQQLVDHGVHSDLTRVAALYQSNEELQINISRVFGKLSLHDTGYRAFTESTCHLRQIVRCLQAHTGLGPLVVRHTFVLGNLTANSDNLRNMLMFDCDGMHVLPGLVERYWRRDRQLAQAPGAGAPAAAPAATCSAR
mmetsp:Transcript_19189/g.54197  ORF Transcript_19189/g.54197 Transcript_19189/m.54197 type:complete len:540 (+) Transcript_19189:103-1722(+)